MESPYSDPLKKVASIKPWFQRDDKAHTITFTGESLEIRIPKRFEVYGMIDISESVSALGIMDLIIDGKYHTSIKILSRIQIEPSEIGEMTYEGVPYLVLYLQKGDVFIRNTLVTQNANVIYTTYVEFITRGKPLYTLGYDSLALIFDRVRQMTGNGIGVDRVLFELIVSHLARDPNDLFKQYRYTTMLTPMQLIPMRSVSYAPTSTTARTFGSYFDNGLTASLLTKSTQSQPFENLIRGIPTDI